MVITNMVIVIQHIEDAVYFDAQRMKAQRRCLSTREYCQQGAQVFCYKLKIYAGIPRI